MKDKKRNPKFQIRNPKASRFEILGISDFEIGISVRMLNHANRIAQTIRPPNRSREVAEVLERAWLLPKRPRPAAQAVYHRDSTAERHRRATHGARSQ